MNQNTSKFIGKSLSEIADNSIKDYLVHFAEEKQFEIFFLSQEEVKI